ncbi:MAG: hypothetical protein LBI84_01370, partial [Propionibacteriaceae bacterium]|nr:hypothetical protein [Propionibacteriaceae bacterium]
MSVEPTQTPDWSEFLGLADGSGRSRHLVPVPSDTPPQAPEAAADPETDRSWLCQGDGDPAPADTAAPTFAAAFSPLVSANESLFSLPAAI